MPITRRITATALGIGIVIVAGAGVATATDGKALLVGKINAAKKVTTLSNKRGTPLSLKAKSGKPPLRVSNSVEVPKLNAAEVGGLSATKLQKKISTKEQCSDQPGRDVTGLSSSGAFTCDYQQGVSNGNNPGGAPLVTAPATGRYLIFANVEVNSTLLASIPATCEVKWNNAGAVPVSEAADTTYVTVPASASNFPVALSTSGAQQITAGAQPTVYCGTSPITIASGDVTLMAVAFQ